MSKRKAISGFVARSQFQGNSKSRNHINRFRKQISSAIEQFSDEKHLIKEIKPVVNEIYKFENRERFFLGDFPLFADN